MERTAASSPGSALNQPMNPRLTFLAFGTCD